MAINGKEGKKEKFDIDSFYRNHMKISIEGIKSERILSDLTSVHHKKRNRVVSYRENLFYINHNMVIIFRKSAKNQESNIF
jgi:hypothetical protein